MVKLEGLEDVEHYVYHLAEFFLELVRPYEQVGVVLGEAANSGKSVELSALLVAVNGSELGKPQRKILVGTRLGLVNLAVMRTVHRLEQELLAFLRSGYRTE